MKKALVIDDEPLIRKSLSMTLQIEGFEVKSADGGVMGLKLWSQEKPDLVFLDVLMPDKSGIEVLKEADKQGVKIVLMSAYSGDEIVPKDISSLGAHIFLQKPFEDIFKTVSNVIKKLEML